MLRRSILGMVFLTTACSATGPGDPGLLANFSNDIASSSVGSATRSDEGARVARVTRSVFAAAAELCRLAAPDAAVSGSSCTMPIVVAPTRNVFASTNGERVRISQGFVGLSGTDDELAFVLAHEVAHILMRHRVSLADADRRSQEHEADTLGLYITIRAGYDGRTAIRILPRLAGHLGNDAGGSRFPGFFEREQRLLAQVERMNGLASAAKMTRRQLAANEIVARVVSEAGQ